MKSNHPPLTNPFGLLKQGCERPWEVAVPPFKVAPRTWYVGNSWVGAYLIKSSEGLILIDATMQPQVYLVFESIRMLGFDPHDIKLLLLSHAHYDHCGGVRAVLELSGAKLWMAKEDADFICERPEMILTEGYPYGEIKADFFYSDSKPIILGDIQIDTIHTPGHTPGTTSFFFDTVDTNGMRSRCGIHGGVGVNTLSDDFIQEYNLPFSTRRDYMNSMLKVKDLPVDITLGSHPGQTNMLDKVPSIQEDFNPFLDRTVWPSLIEKRIAMIQEILDTTELEA
jgi:metallo-beta-lactamase class B